jgi:hypothetical protein
VVDALEINSLARYVLEEPLVRWRTTMFSSGRVTSLLSSAIEASFHLVICRRVEVVINE